MPKGFGLGFGLSVLVGRALSPSYRRCLYHSAADLVNCATEAQHDHDRTWGAPGRTRFDLWLVVLNRRQG